MTTHYPFIGMSDCTKGDISVSIPLYQNYPYNLRWPLPFMVITVPSDDDIRAIKQMENSIKDELNIKQLIVKKAKSNNE